MMMNNEPLSERRSSRKMGSKLKETLEQVYGYNPSFQHRSNGNSQKKEKVFEKNRPPSDKPTTSADAEPSTSKKKKSEMKESLRNIPTRTRNVLLISLLAVAFLVALIAFILAVVLAENVSSLSETVHNNQKRVRSAKKALESVSQELESITEDLDAAAERRVQAENKFHQVKDNLTNEATRLDRRLQEAIGHLKSESNLDSFWLFPLNGYKYHYTVHGGNWDEMRQKCKAINAELAGKSLKDKIAREYVAKQILGRQSVVFIGLRRERNGVWTWLDGTVASGLEWDTVREQNQGENCAVLGGKFNHHKFKSADCKGTAFAAVCEVKIS